MLPAIFISHGAPTLPLDDCPARDFLKGLGDTLPRPRAVLAISAHWETARPAVNAPLVNDTIHDFGGFPEALYRMRYPAPGSAELAQAAKHALAEAGFATDIDSARGLDHGAWVPLMLMYPEADIPVAQLSLQTPLGPGHHLKLGRVLAPLRDDFLILGSGGFVHNLRTLTRWQLDAPEPSWSAEFGDWVDAALMQGRTADLASYRVRAPYGAHAHPSEEHFLPLFVALGAGGEGAKATRLHKSACFGSQRMDAYAFG